MKAFKNVLFDLESNGLKDTMDKIHCIVCKCADTGKIKRFVSDYSFVSEADGLIPEAIKLLEDADLVIGHNIIDFDIPAIRLIYPKFKVKDSFDTLLCSRLIWTNLKDLDFGKARAGKYPEGFKFYGQHGLKAWGYRLGVFKGSFGEGTDWAYLDQEMLDYCVQDVEVTDRLYKVITNKHYSTEAIDLEHSFARIIQRQVDFGFEFDEEKAVALHSHLVQRKRDIERELQSSFKGWIITMKTPECYYFKHEDGDIKADTKTKCVATAYEKYGRDTFYSLTKSAITKQIVAGKLKSRHIPFNPTSRDHVAQALIEKYNWQPQEFGENGKPTIDENVLKKLEYPEASLLSEAFKVGKILGQLAEGREGWLKIVRKGRVHGGVITNGAVTGRCTHKHPNVAQVPAAKFDKETKKPIFGYKGGFGADCRQLFTVPKGFKLVGADASGLELRCLAHYMAKWDKGKYGEIILNGDIHSENQHAAGLPTRNNAKTFIYGFLYGAGDAKIGEIVNGGMEEGKVLRAKFLKRIPALGALTKAVKAKAYKSRTLKGLDGRVLNVRSSHSALNTLLQSAGALVMKKALIICDELLQKEGYTPLSEGGKDYEFVANIHDEYQVQVREDITTEVGEIMVKAMQIAGDYFKFRCPIDGEYGVGDSWLETH